MDVIEPDVYAAARKRLHTVSVTASRRELIWAAFGVLGVVYAMATSWSARGQIAGLKVEASKCDPVVLDRNGYQLSAVPLGKAEQSVVDGIVISRLSDTITKLRGVDAHFAVVAANWRREPELFETEEAYRKLMEYRRAAKLDTPENVQTRQASETVDIAPVSWGHDAVPTAPDEEPVLKYWLRWTETHRRTNGGSAKDAPEQWFGEFEVRLNMPEASVGDWNPLRIVRWDWRRELVQ